MLRSLRYIIRSSFSRLFFSSRRRHTRFDCDWSSDMCSSDLFDVPGNPLEHHPTWKNVRCSRCGSAARRDTDTLDTFVDSSWYFARFSNALAAEPVDSDAAHYWLPVDQYIGGIEHAILHLLYARFFMRALTRLRCLEID